MNKETKAFISSKIEELQTICDELEYETEALEIDDTEIPTVNIFVAENDQGNQVTVTCNLIPMTLSDIPVLFLQFYMCVSAPIPEEKKEILNEFIRLQNERFMIGNILIFSDSVCLKYSLYLDIDKNIDPDLFARSLDVFIYEANTIAKKSMDLIDGTMTLDQALETGTFFY